MGPGVANILCATDFSKYSHNVVRYGAGFSRTFGARLHISHTVPVPRSGMYGAELSEIRSRKEKKTRLAREKIQSLLAEHAADGEAVVTHGEPVEETVRIVREMNIDLVIAGSHGISGLKRFLAGTVVERMARHLPKPFLVVPARDRRRKAAPDGPFALKRLLVSCDLSPKSAHLARFAFDLAGAFNASVHLLHAIEAPLSEELAGTGTAASYGEAERALKARLEQRLRALVPEDAKADGGATPHLVPGIPEEALLTVAENIRADMILVGVRSHTAMEKLFIGSTTEAALRGASCPVITVPTHGPEA